MARYLLYLIVLVTWFLPFGSARAGVFVCNNTGLEVSVAVAWTEGSGWLSKGWWNLNPQECALPLDGPIKNRYVYYFAKGNRIEWQGDQGSYFCADHNKRYYWTSDTNKCDGYLFRKVDTGDAPQYTIELFDSGGDPQAAARSCAAEVAEGRDAFIQCWMSQVATTKQRQILDCIKKTDSGASLAICSAQGDVDPGVISIADCSLTYTENRATVSFVKCIAAGKMGDRDAQIVNCAIDHNGNYAAMALCAAGVEITPEQARTYKCVSENFQDYRQAGLCIIGSSLSPDQMRIADCVLQNKGSYAQMGICAVGGGLTPEQQVFVQCAATTGGQPYAMAGCVGTQLTLNELQKCLDQGVGGSGCFGDDNTAVVTIRNAWKDVTEGPGPSNDLVGRDGFAMRTLSNVQHDVENGPGENNDLVGRNGFVCKTLFGGC